MYFSFAAAGRQQVNPEGLCRTDTFPVMFPETVEGHGMTSSRKSPLASYRRRMKSQGLVRVEVQVRKEDAPLVRSVAAALADPERAAEARALLRQRFEEPPAKGLKALLAEAPLEGIDLDRPRDTGRDIDL